MRIPSNWPTLQWFFLWGVTFWQCRDLQAWCVNRTRFLARNFNSLCVCCSLFESRSFLLYFTIPGDISCYLCSEIGRTNAELRAKKKMLLKRATRATKGKQQPAHVDPPENPPPLPSSRCLPPASTPHLVSSRACSCSLAAAYTAYRPALPSSHLRTRRCRIRLSGT